MTPDFLQDWFRNPVRPRVVVLGNQKGGSGKSTTAIHLVFGLMSCGYAVGSVDLDGDQATLTHFVENRKRLAARGDALLAMPEHRLVESSLEQTVAGAEEDEAARVAQAFAELLDQDYIVVDTPGSDTFLSRLGHILADILTEVGGGTMPLPSYTILHREARLSEDERIVLLEWCRSGG